LNKAISDKSTLSISVPFLIQAIGFIAILVWTYGELNARIQFLEHRANMNMMEIEELKELQDKPIPSDVRQDTKLEDILYELERIRNILDIKD